MFYDNSQSEFSLYEATLSVLIAAFNDFDLENESQMAAHQSQF